MAWIIGNTNMERVGSFDELKVKGNFCLHSGFQQKLLQKFKVDRSNTKLEESLC
jgi:hypothetical protein